MNTVETNCQTHASAEVSSLQSLSLLVERVSVSTMPGTKPQLPSNPDSYKPHERLLCE